MDQTFFFFTVDSQLHMLSFYDLFTFSYTYIKCETEISQFIVTSLGEGKISCLTLQVYELLHIYVYIKYKIMNDTKP